MRLKRAFVLAAFFFTACAPAAIDSVSVHAVRESAAVDTDGDAADDPAIWVAADPANSVVVATQKKGGLYVFDLSGAIVQTVPGGRPNNVDLRPDFAWADGVAPIVGAGDRSDNALVLWRFDPATARLDPTPRARLATGFTEVYGFCLGRIGDGFIAIATDKEGEVGVWRIAEGADGAVAGERIAQFTLGTITEGCVIDDDAGVYYLGDELNGIWRVALNDASGANKTLIDRVGEGGNLVADVEGLSIWHGANGGGYLVASVQGANRFAVYDRGEGNTYRGAFTIEASADGLADAVSGTDGIDVVSAPIGADYPAGMLVVQDDENTDPAGMQNFKYVSWADVAAALTLD